MSQEILVRVYRDGRHLSDISIQDVMSGLKNGRILSTDEYEIGNSLSRKQISNGLWLQSEHTALVNQTRGANKPEDKPETMQEENVQCASQSGHAWSGRCPHCNSERIQTARAIYEAGTINYESSGYSQNTTGGAKAFKSGRVHSTKSSRQSVLAERLSPPAGIFDGTIGGILLFVTIYLVAQIIQICTQGGLVLTVITMLPIGGLIYWFRYSARARKAEKQRDDLYNRTWYCHKCSRTFIA
jgi:hypothetical protein